MSSDFGAWKSEPEQDLATHLVELATEYRIFASAQIAATDPDTCRVTESQRVFLALSRAYMGLTELVAFGISWAP